MEPVHGPGEHPIVRKFPNLANLNLIRRDLPVSQSVADHYSGMHDSPDGTVFPGVDAWLNSEGFERSRFYERIGFPGGAGGGIQLAKTIRDKRDWLRETHGFALVSIYKGGTGHCLVFHTGPSGEWMLMDVNYGWFLFPNYVHFEVFLAAYWLETEYDFPTAYALDTFKRVVGTHGDFKSVRKQMKALIGGKR